MSKEILSLKTVDGELFAGEFVETKKEYGRDVHILNVDGITRHVPVMQCMWWALGEESVPEVEEERRRLMKEYAKRLLKQGILEGEGEEDGEAYFEHGEVSAELSEEDVEEIERSRKAVRDPRNRETQNLIRNIASHQRGLSERSLNDKVIQPGEESPKQPRPRKRSVSSISRLPDDTPEV